jgi:hypothetical protein
VSVGGIDRGITAFGTRCLDIGPFAYWRWHHNHYRLAGSHSSFEYGGIIKNAPENGAPNKKS